MKITESLLRFICEHADDDPERLLLSAKRYEGVDVPFAARQILIRKRIRDKLPSWHANPSIIFPGRTASEQCSSEQTARYKQRLLESEKHLCDLTGGLGIDTYFFSQCVEQISYVELSEMYFETAMYNFSVLQAGNINGYQGDAVNMIKQFDSADVFFIDPARRGEGNTRVFALSDCDPDLCIILPELLKRAPKVIAKLSPMLDIRHTLKLLPQTAAVHVVSVRNECKELLFVLTPEVHAEPRIHCVNYMTGGTEQSFSFQLSEEHTCRQIIADSIDLYLYEPDASVLKAGAYKQTALQKG
ncbi:MAG: SAM-dependent methyltransferase [Tannerella sp.]|jgi:hypothetical protein|nr:SAM-dependent methyltransferase [Tannerella sp.]